MSVMTSLYPDVHQVYTYERQLSADIATLAEILQASGYATAGFISNPMLHGKYGFSNGFDLYDDFTISLDSGLDIFGRHNEVFEDQHHVCTSELLTRTTVKWLQHRPERPFFLFVFYMDPHYDYVPPVPYDTMFDPNYDGDMDGRGIKREPRHSQRPSARDLKHLRALYDGEIRYTDTQVAGLLQAFAAEGLLENTFVIVFGDHGDEFYEHGKTAHDRTLYDEIVHVPLIFWWPGRVPGGKRIETVTSLVDVMPTVLDYLGLARDGFMQGISVRPWVEGDPGVRRQTVWAELNTWTHVQAVIGNQDKLVRNVGTDTWELYDLFDDPREQTNLYDESSAAETRLAMMARWQQWTKRNQADREDLTGGGEAERILLDEQQLLRLKALGYVQ
jgi:arylsulfatase A-like enzyme